MRALIGFVTVALTLLAAAGNASAQDERWTPWIGCWDRVGQELLNASLKGRSSNLPLEEDAESRPRVCVTLSAPNEVTLTTSVPDEPETTLTVRADGALHPLDDADCHGEQRAEWSDNGRRLFTNGEVTCRDGVPRYVSGLGLITDDGVWIDVRSFRIGQQITTRVSRYRRADEASAESEPQQGLTTLTLAEVKEASKKVSEAVLEAAVTETGANIIINRRSLTELADAGVPPKVLDVLVALAYPEKFRVERVNSDNPTFAAARSVSVDHFPSTYYVPFYVPTAPSTSRAIGGIFVGGSSGTLIPLPPPPPGTANAINGQGYTRISPADVPRGDGTRPAIVRSASGDSAPVSSSSSSSGSSSSSSSSSPSPSSSGSSDGGGASSGGFSGGGGNTGRTAQPR